MHTSLARRSILAVHGPGQVALATFLLGLTFFTATTLGAVWSIATQTEVSTALPFWLSPETIAAVWSDPAMLKAGATFSVPLLVILLAHELGHYIPCRRYRLPVTLPYFLPAPIALGTLGAFIKIRQPIRTRRELLDIGAGGPIAGFLVLIPFLLVGAAKSLPASLATADLGEAEALLFLPGQSIASQVAVWLFHGPLPAETVLNPHPFLLAAWVGLLATSLNLLPMAQLDGGHILYSMIGRTQHKLAWPLWLALAACGFLWPGWWLWCGIVAIMGIRHPPVIDDSVSLDQRRLRLGWASWAILALSFMPVPLEVIPVL